MADFETFDIVRYRKGATALMRIDKIEGTGDMRRFYGKHITGGEHSCWASDCKKATPFESNLFKSYSYDTDY